MRYPLNAHRKETPAADAKREQEKDLATRLESLEDDDDEEDEMLE